MNICIRNYRRNYQDMGKKQWTSNPFKAPLCRFILIFSFLIIAAYASSQEYSYFEPLSLTGQKELVKHPPILLDIREGIVVSPITDIYSRQPEYEYNEKGKPSGIILPNKYRIQIVYDSQDRVTKIIGPGTRNTIISYPDEKTRIVEQGGDKTVYEYSPDRKFLKITDSLGQSVLKEFDDNGNVIGFTDPAGIKTTFSYNNNGNLISFTNGLGQKTDFLYDTKNKLTSVTTPSGRKYQRLCDDNDNLIQLIDPAGKNIKISYNNLNLVSSITNPRGFTTKIDYTDAGYPAKFTNPMGETTSIGYDQLGRAAKITSPEGTKTIFNYDLYNNVTRVFEPIGKITELKYDDMGNLINVSTNGIEQSNFTYDTYGRLVATKDAAGKTIDCIYEASDNPVSITYPNGAVYKFEYDKKHNCTSMIDPLGRVTKYIYTPTSLLSKIIYPNETEEDYEYDILGRPTAKKDIRGNKTSYEYDVDGNIIAITDPSGNTAKYSYNDSGELIKASGSIGNGLNYQYDDSGNLISITDELGLSIKFSYDSLNRISKLTDYKGSIVEYTYDSNDNVTKIIDKYGNTILYKYLDTYVVESNDPYNGSFKYKHDNFGRLTSISNNLGDIITKSYDLSGRLVRTKDLLGHTQSYEYDLSGNIASITDYNGSIYSYKYDLVNTLTEVKDPLGNVYKINYDDAQNTQSITGTDGEIILQYKFNKYGEVIQKTYPKGISISYDYDSYGNLISEQKPDKSVIKYAYDTFQRLTQIIYPDGNTDKFQYDNYGNIVGLEGSDFKEVYKYDQWLRLTEVKRTKPKAVTRYEYDNSGRLVNIIYPSGREFTYSYDNLNRLVEINDKDNAKFLFTYDMYGNLLSIQYPNGTKAIYEYDPLLKIIKVEHRKSNGDIITELTYNYDANGNVISIKRQEEAEKKFSYDKNNQLTLDPPSAVGQCEYDINGNVSKLEGITFSYDSKNRLKTVKTSSGNIISYAYSPQDKRVWKDSKEGRVYFIYSGDDIIAEIKKGNVSTEYLYGPFIDQPLAIFTKEGVYYFHADRIGSIIALTDSQGEVTATYEYDPWGNITASTGKIPNPYRFTAREYEPEADIYYFRARYYSPKLGQFLTKDPYPENTSDPLTFNPYIYARNNPLTNKDPYGLQGRPSVPSAIFTESAPSSSGGEMLPATQQPGGGTYTPSPTVQPVPSPKPPAIEPTPPQKSIPVMSAVPPPSMSALTWGHVREKPPKQPEINAGFPTIRTPPPNVGAGIARAAQTAGEMMANSINNMERDKALNQINDILQGYPPRQKVGITMVVEGHTYPATGIKVIDKIAIHRSSAPANTVLRPVEWPNFREIIHEAIPGRGLTPDQIKVIMNQMVQAQNQIRNLLANTNLWTRLSGQTIAGPRQVSTASQAGSAQTVSTDIGLAQQQAIDRVRGQRAELEALQNTIQNLMNQPVKGGDWGNSWGTALQNWQRVIRDIIGTTTAPPPGGTSTGGGGTDTGGTSGDSSCCGGDPC